MRGLMSIFAVVALIMFLSGGIRAGVMDGLVVHFNFDEEGNVLEDLSGTGNDGTVKGSPLWIDGPSAAFGTALEFNGAGDQVIVKDDDTLDVGEGDITISLWIKYSDDQPNPFPRLISNGMPLWDGNRPGFELTVKGSGPIDPGHPLGVFYGMSGNGPPRRQEVDGGLGELADGNWYHVVGLKDGEEGRVYVNGELTGRGPLTPMDISNDLPLVIGASGQTGVQYYKGAVDDVVVHMRALTDHEIATLSAGALAAAGSVELEGKLPTTWGDIKGEY